MVKIRGQEFQVGQPSVKLVIQSDLDSLHDVNKFYNHRTNNQSGNLRNICLCSSQRAQSVLLVIILCLG